MSSVLLTARAYFYRKQLQDHAKRKKVYRFLFIHSYSNITNTIKGFLCEISQTLRFYSACAAEVEMGTLISDKMAIM